MHGARLHDDENRLVLVENELRGSWVPLASLHREVEGNDQLYSPSVYQTTVKGIMVTAGRCGTHVWNSCF
jgi:hypothetical protein